MRKPIASSEATIWARIIHPDGELTPRTARDLLRLEFPQDDVDRMHDLAAKARAGSLSPEEQVEIDDYERVGCLLSTLKSKARLLLKKTRLCF